MDDRALPLRFYVQGREIGGETLAIDAGADVLVITSCSADLGLELRSAYLGADHRRELLVAESLVVGLQDGEFAHRMLDRAGGALTYQRRRLLYDHLARLQDLALQRGCQLRLEGVDAAAAVLDPLTPFASIG